MALFTRTLAIGCVAAAMTSASGQPPGQPPDSGAQPPAAASAPTGELKEAPAQTPPAPDQQSGAPETGPKQRDLTDIAHRLLGISIKPGGDKPRSLDVLVLPIIDSNPTYGFTMGIEATGTYRPKDPATQTSTFWGGIAYSEKSEYFAGLEHNFYPAGNRRNLQGEWGYADASLPVYGLGANSPSSRQRLVAFREFSIHQSVRRRIGHGLYVGPGYNLDLFNDLTVKGAKAGQISAFEAYGEGTHGQAVSSGLSMELLLDQRDNPVNATRGAYASAIYKMFPKLLGSDQNWQSLLLEARDYIKFPHSSQHVLALWAIGWFTLSGRPPYLDLPAVANPWSHAARGYTIGRYRGRNALDGEAEYRFGLTRDGLLGGVVFGSLSSVSQPGSDRFEHLIPAVGAGLRVKFDKSNDANLRIDYAQGKDGENGWYLGVHEAY
jgi:hypothetical protein